MAENRPRILVFSFLFPHAGQPNAGVFIRERVFRVGKHLPLVVVAPVPWFPFQGLIRRWWPHFRPNAPRHETQTGFEIYRPRYFCIPGIFKALDGFFMALGSLSTLLRLRRTFKFNLIDAHFGYPDGYAATLLGKWLNVPVVVTLRGTEIKHSSRLLVRHLLLKGLRRACQIISVSGSLKKHAIRLGIEEEKVKVVGNGVDIDCFYPIPRDQARRYFNIAIDAPVLVSVGGLVERKGFHRVIDILPVLRKSFPGLRYLIVGGASGEGDWSERLRRQVHDLGLQETVLFLGVIPPEQLKLPLSAANVFVLATRNEGWANVFLEAMACGLPVVTTDVGGNAEVVSKPEYGTIVPFGVPSLLEHAIEQALRQDWDRVGIIEYAKHNSWDSRVEILVQTLKGIIIQQMQSMKEAKPADQSEAPP